jgi:uncharacterized protein YbjQ (UPF0145 family)
MVSEHCPNCAAKITDGGTFGTPNLKLEAPKIEFVNFIDNSSYESLCQKCGGAMYDSARNRVRKAIQDFETKIKDQSTAFPMMTVHQLPAGTTYKIKTLVTSNVTVGTGIFSEFSQGMSDLFGATNTNTGMAHKVNSGEAVARGMLASKAMTIGANCIIGVDIDYGITNNNAATINMQGTAVKIDSLTDVLAANELKLAQAYLDTYQQMLLRMAWLEGDLRES